MLSTTSPAGSTRDLQPEDTLASLLPPQRRRAGPAVALLAVLVLLAAWSSPQLLRPSIWDGSGGGTFATFTAPGPQVLTTTLMQTQSWTPFTLEEVEDVPGARVLDAWLVTGAGVRAVEQGVAQTPPTAEDYLDSVLGDPAGAHLPRRVSSGGPAALLVLWAIEDCAALEEDGEPLAVLRNVVGATTTDTLPFFTAPDPDLLSAPQPPNAGGAPDVCPHH